MLQVDVDSMSKALVGQVFVDIKYRDQECSVILATLHHEMLIGELELPWGGPYKSSWEEFEDSRVGLETLRVKAGKRHINDKPQLALFQLNPKMLVTAHRDFGMERFYVGESEAQVLMTITRLHSEITRECGEEDSHVRQNHLFGVKSRLEGLVKRLYLPYRAIGQSKFWV